MAEANGAITGTLTKFAGWPSGTLAGEGYFLALKFSGLDENATGARVGLVPSNTGMALQTLDEDMDVVLKITDKERQELVVEVFDGDGNTTVTRYSLHGLTLEDVGA